MFCPPAMEINRLLDFSGVLYNFEINCTLCVKHFATLSFKLNFALQNVTFHTRLEIAIAK
jgi:hypothetical protein